MSLLHDPMHPGEVLKELYLDPLDIGAIGLARRLGVPRTRIERLVKGATSMTPDTALRLARVAQGAADAAFAGGNSHDWDLAAADLLVHDAQYTPEEYLLKEGWGHSSYVDAVNFACDAQVKKLLLFHHEPEYNDLKIDGIIKHCRVLLKERGCAIACAGACEGAVWIV